jgi:hypothetical protein
MDCNPEAEFLDLIRTKVLRVFFHLAIHSHLYLTMLVTVLIERDALNDLHILVEEDVVHGVPILLETDVLDGVLRFGDINIV